MSIPSLAMLASTAVPVALLSASLAQAQIAPGTGVNPRTVWSDPPEAFAMRVVADGFDGPWEVAWGPDEHLWITERTGKRVVRVDPADGTRKVAVTIDEVEQKLGQDGLLGLALHSDLLAGSDYVYVMYTYDADPGPDEARRAKIRRYTYDPATETLVEPLDILTDLPHGPDHGASRIVFGPDAKLYASRGDHGANFLAYYCEPIRAQELPAAADVAARNWRGYEGKILRVELDGSIPADNPVLNGVQSHVFSYGHRNPQGMAFGPDGRLYAAEHGQDTDDEVNRIDAGRNYGWPLIAGFKDDLYYTYANWSASAPTPCASLTYGRDVPSSVPLTKESEVNLPDFTPPIATFFTVPSDYDVRRLGNATAALAGLDVYASPTIPGWNPSILVAGLANGTIYRLELNPSSDAPVTYFKSQNRYRDLAIAPNGRRIYVITDSRGRALNAADEMTPELANPGALIEFTYTGARGIASVDVVAHPDPLAALQSPDPTHAANKRLVFDLWRSVVNAGHVEMADELLTEGYIQHSPVLRTGRKAFKEIFSVVPRREIPELVEPPLVASVAEGNLVAMALIESLPAREGSPAYTTTHFNLFRVEGDRLAEHWHSMQTAPGPDVPLPEDGGPQPVTGASGAAQLALLESADPRLAANKRLVFDAWRQVVDAGRVELAERYLDAEFIEHNPNAAPGREGFTAHFAARTEAPVEAWIRAPIVAFVAEGDLVVLVTMEEHPHPNREGRTYTTTWFDMFRVVDNRLVEHWDAGVRP